MKADAFRLIYVVKVDDTCTSFTHSRRKRERGAKGLLSWRSAVCIKFLKAMEGRANENGMFDSVWDALEDNPIVAHSMERRANLLLLVRKKIAAAKHTQAEAVKILKISRPRVSDLQRGKIRLFSLDTLLEFLERLKHHNHTASPPCS